MAGIQPIGQHEQQGMRMLQSILQQKQQQGAPVPRRKKNICPGSAKLSKEGGEESRLSGNVSYVASGVANDCTCDMLTDFLVDKGINPVEIEQLTKPEVVSQVRTLTFRVAVKAGEYGSALKPEVWPYRVGVRHYRPPR